MLSDRAELTANTGMTSISTANTNVDGTGTLGTVITGATTGTLVRTVTVKGTVTTTRGMIRLFVNDGGSNTVLIAEIEVPPVSTSSGIDHSFSETIDLDFYLANGYILKASTNNGSETFQVIADAVDWSN